MFCREESLSKFLKCPICNLKMKAAKILPCGIFCITCVTDFLQNNKKGSKEFQCKQCKENHLIPANGFSNWKELSEFYAEEFTLEDIYRGESIDKMKKNLKLIEKQIEKLNGIDVVKEHCSQLRRDVDSEAELIIKQIHNSKETLIDEINTYESKCIANLNADSTKNQKFKNFCNELKTFHEQWSQYLNKNQIQDSEINKGNNYVSQLESRFKIEKKSLDLLIYNDKVMCFEKSNVKIEKNFFGKMDFRAIDINSFYKVKLKDILPNFDESLSSIENFDSFDEEKFVVVYPNKSSKISIAIIGKNRSIINSSDLNINHIHKSYINSDSFCRIKLKALKNSFVFYMKDYNDSAYLATVNSSLQLTNNKRISYKVKSLDANEINIYCLSINYSSSQIMIFDNQLVNIKNVGQHNYPQSSFYLNEKVLKLAYRKGNFFCLYPDRLDVINESSGILSRSIGFIGEDLTWDSEGNLMILSIASSKIWKYNFDEKTINEIKIKNASVGLEFSVDKEDNILFSNRTERLLYFKSN